MIEADKTAVNTKVARLKAKFLLAWYLDKILVRFPTTDLATDVPLLLAMNHPGYMDTEVALFLVEEILGRDYYMMAAACTVKDKPYMRKFGVFGVDQNDKLSVSQSLLYGASLLRKQSSRCLVVFPQGGWVRSTERPLHIYPGVAQIARFVRNVMILPVALHYDMFINKQPQIYIRIGEPIQFNGNMPSVPVLTEIIRQSMEQELDVLQDELYSYELDDYVVMLKQFITYLFRH